MLKMNIIYACYGKAGLDCLYQLISQKEIDPQNILALTYKNRENITLLEHIKRLKIEYIVKSINENTVINRLEEFEPDFLFSIYYRDIIGKEVLELIKKTAVNLHPSLLPDYKGCFSAPWALINGENKTGITYHLIGSGVDSGNIILQRELDIMPWDTGFSLFHRLVGLGTESFSKMFQQVVRESETGTPQLQKGRLYKRELPFKGLINLNWRKDKIGRFIRAMYFPPFEGAKLKYRGREYQFMTMDEFEGFCAKNGINFE